jgi:malto-oligosyltrehalose synthase/4-alpha-glucanotransferase
MFDPVATYRIQFHKGFNFKNFEAIIPYLVKLGISTVYASPIFKAVPGSTHGYDCTDPLIINPEIGTGAELLQLSAQLKREGINWLQDIVPNHMAYHIDNPWIRDLLQNGPASAYAAYFDIYWDKGKLMCPFLNGTVQESINDASLVIDKRDGCFVLKYYDNIFPVNEASTLLLSTLSSSGSQEFLNDKSLIQRIADEQYYTLCHWQETDRHINYRRFFLVNGLICLNIHDPKVFNHYHRYIADLVKRGIFQGLRLDHIDGLYDPEAYLITLRKLVGEEVYITSEKILESDEELPQNWPIEGTTGYDFSGLANLLFADSNGKKQLADYYDILSTSAKPLTEQVKEKKAYILYHHMNGELDNLCSIFIDTKAAGAYLDPAAIREAIGLLLIHLPVYRFYGNRLPLPLNEQEQLTYIFKTIKTKSEAALQPAIHALENALLFPPAGTGEAVRHFYQRCMQLSGPLMAKGVEDTLMYVHNSFIGHNEVGNTPLVQGLSIDGFHHKIQTRRQYWPLTINATSTHDTKRGEDTRARLNVLTELPEKWIAAVNEWERMLATGNDLPAGDERYLIYQSLLGALPMNGIMEEGFTDRFGEFVVKALREAKVHSDWGKPDEQYEQKTAVFATGLLKPGTPIAKSLLGFYKDIADYGMLNALAQLLLKFTCPGIPDTYQGCESWDLSLVDPDNRRAIDYIKHNELLKEVMNVDSIAQLWDSRNTGAIKIWLTKVLLEERKANQVVFKCGHYLPLQIIGKYKDNVIAYARRYNADWYVTVIPLHLARLTGGQFETVKAIDWSDTAVALPAGAPANFQNMLSGTKSKASSTLMVSDLFHELPLALLKSAQQPNNRRAGVLMSVSSLPSAYGIGDIGGGAKEFADFLNRSGQGIWQLLPVNPITETSTYSPYSALSCMAGNTLLIDPEWFLQYGLLDKETLRSNALPPSDKVDYGLAANVKEQLLSKAWKNYNRAGSLSLKFKFEQFCIEEREWLHDYACYEVLRAMYKTEAWYQWPEEYKTRNAAALEQLIISRAEDIGYEKWKQFVFFIQWADLKSYCNSLGISMFGDIPFYLNVNAADVWVNPGLFNIDASGNITLSAGVPPDYFSKDGQLWNMPTYKWDVLKANGYDWWIRRLKANFGRFDMLRLDHFRAFNEYWEVPAGETTAVNGRWLKGAGADFFDTVEHGLGKLHLIAEDLGDDMEDVYKLRDKIGLQGMKVLQFAFGENMPVAVDAPHNYINRCIVYTGTHDNNTIVGWFKNELNEEDRNRLDAYMGKTITVDNVHQELLRLAYATVADIAILPLQDILALDESDRMNTPGTDTHNWEWRLLPGTLNRDIETYLGLMAIMYNRV